MPVYSRKAKYEELRKSLQNESETGPQQTPELSPYIERLNKIAPGNFEAPEVNTPETLPPVQPRRAQTYTQAETVPQQPARKEEPVPAPGYSNAFSQNGANYTSTFNNEYMNQFVQEAKQYNIDQGNAFSANTDLDILRNLRGETPKAPSKPYPDEEEPAIIKPISQDNRREPVRDPKPAPMENDTADISFATKPARKPAKTPHWKDEIFNEDSDLDETGEDDFIDDPRTMTKDDIAAEVRRMIDNSQKPESARRQRKAVHDDTDDKDYFNSRPTREQQLLNETSMIRSQMVDYEDNLNDVNDKMHRTNQILNIVLIILIIALALVLAVVVYWVLLSKGVIS